MAVIGEARMLWTVRYWEIVQATFHKILKRSARSRYPGHEMWGSDELQVVRYLGINAFETEEECAMDYHDKLFAVFIEAEERLAAHEQRYGLQRPERKS